jgi:sulfur carrier protein
MRFMSILLSQNHHMLELSVNGETRRFEDELDLARLIERLALAGRKLAVERNGEIVPRSRYAETSLVNGDRLEIVVAVGGG